MMIDSTHSLKSLQVSRTKLQSWRKKCRETRDRAAADLLDAERQLGQIEAKIAAIENGDTVVVSEHALLRYLERFENINLDSIALQVQALEPEFIIKKGNTIVTIVDGEPAAPSPNTEQEEKK